MTSPSGYRNHARYQYAGAHMCKRGGDVIIDFWAPDNAHLVEKPVKTARSFLLGGGSFGSIRSFGLLLTGSAL